jgi:MFS family permease
MAGTDDRASFRRLLRHREFRVVVAGLAVSAAGTWLYNVALLVFVYQQTHSGTWVAVATILRMAPAVLFGALGGVIADRYERHSVMIASDLVRACVQLGLTVVAWRSGPTLLAVLLAFLSTTAGTPFRPAAGAITPLLVGERDLAAANGLLVTVDNVALVLGPAAGGALLAIGSPAFAFLFNAVSFLVSAISLSSISTRSRPPEESRGRRVLSGMAVGARTLRATVGGPLLAGFLAGSTLIYGAETVLLVLVSERALGTGPEGLGYLLAAVGFGSIIAIGIANRVVDAPQPAIPLALGLVGMGVPVALLPLVHQAWIAVLLMVIQGVGVVLLDVLVPTVLQRAVDPAVIGRVIGIVNTMVIAASVIGSLVAPLLVDALGLNGALVVIGAGVPAVAVAALPRIRGLTATTRRRSAEVAQRLDLIGKLRIFDGATRATLEAVAAAAREEHVAAGATVIKEGDPADDFFVVRSGTLDVLARGEVGKRRRTINRLEAGDYFGEIGLIEQIPRTATVRASSDVELLRVKGDDFLDLVNNLGAPSTMLAEGMVTRLTRTHPSLVTPEKVGAAS